MRKKRAALRVVAIIMISSFVVLISGIVLAGESSPEAGKKVYERKGCVACHVIDGVGGKLGPDLTHIGSKKDGAWLKEQVKDPKAHFPNSLMPAFKRISKKDLDHLADYLESLK